MIPRVILALGCTVFLGACQSYTDGTPRTVLEGDDGANYIRVFGGPIPKDVTVVNSVVIGYESRPGVVTTDDWEFEILAPRSWIDEQAERQKVGPADDLWGVDEAKSRIARPIRSWYAPGDLDLYDIYYSQYTSIPYVHFLVKRESVDESRFRVFLSKH